MDLYAFIFLLALIAFLELQIGRMGARALEQSARLDGMARAIDELRQAVAHLAVAQTKKGAKKAPRKK